MNGPVLGHRALTIAEKGGCRRHRSGNRHWGWEQVDGGKLGLTNVVDGCEEGQQEAQATMGQHQGHRQQQLQCFLHPMHP
jgi:hypothetical protein